MIVSKFETKLATGTAGYSADSSTKITAPPPVQAISPRNRDLEAKPAELSPIAAEWLEMLRDAALEGNPSGWDIGQLFGAISSDPQMGPGDRAALWRSLTVDEQARLKTAQGGAGK